MKDYTQLTLKKLTELLNMYPTADIRYNAGSVPATCGAKVLSTDINYDEITNTIYIG